MAACRSRQSSRQSKRFSPMLGSSHRGLDSSVAHSCERVSQHSKFVGYLLVLRFPPTGKVGGMGQDKHI